MVTRWNCAAARMYASTGEIESFRIVREEAIAAGIRRIEAVSGDAARKWAKEEAERQQKKFEMLARKKSDVAALPVFEEGAETDAMLDRDRHARGASRKARGRCSGMGKERGKGERGAVEESRG